MSPEFYSLEMIVAQWVAGAQGNAGHYMRQLIAALAEENNL